MEKRALKILLIFFISVGIIVPNFCICNVTSKNSIEMQMTSSSSPVQKTYDYWLAKMINELDEYWLSTEPFYSQYLIGMKAQSFCSIIANANYWPLNINENRLDLLNKWFLKIFDNIALISNGSLSLFTESYTNYNHITLESNMLALISVINDTYHLTSDPMKYDMLLDVINSTLNTIYLRDINDILVEGFYGFENIRFVLEQCDDYIQYININTLRKTIPLRSFSFNAELITHAILEQINNLVDYNFASWYTKASFGLTCIEAGVEFENETLITYGNTILDEIFNSDEYSDDTDHMGFKFELAQSFLAYNTTYAQKLADFGTGLLFHRVENLLQPIVSSKSFYDILNSSSSSFVGSYLHLAFLKLLKSMHQLFPIEGYDQVINMILYYYLSTLYYDESSNIYNPHISYDYNISNIGLYEHITSVHLYHPFHYALVFSQILDPGTIVDDYDSPIIVTEYTSGIFESSEYYYPFSYSNTFASLENNSITELDQNHDYATLKFVLSDAIVGIKFAEVFINEKLDVLRHQIDYDNPFYYSRTSDITQPKSYLDQLHYYLFLDAEKIASNTTIILRAYDKCDNWAEVQITIKYFDELTSSHSFAYFSFLALILVQIIILVKQQKKQQSIK